MKRKTKIPKDFQVSDDVRRYCAEKWSFLHLPDVMLTDFIDTYERNGRKWSDWDATFKNYIRNSSPTGRFYNVGYWERKCEQARRFKGAGLPSRSDGISGGRHDQQGQPNQHGVSARTGQHDVFEKSTWIPSERGRETLKHIRSILKNGA